MLVVGESLVDVIVTPEAAPQQRPGGSPFNVALGMARSGHQVTFATALGQDPEADLIRAALHQTPGPPVTLQETRINATSRATATIGSGGEATYEFAVDWRLNPVQPPAGVELVHVGSFAAVLEPGSQAVRQLLHETRQLPSRPLVSYDPNVRPPLLGDPATAQQRVSRLVAHSDIVKVSEQDLAWLAPGQDPVTALTDWADSATGAGPALLVLTRGSEGAYARTRAGAQAEVAAPQVDVVDTIGAGDAFMVGLLAAVLSGTDPAGRRAALDQWESRDLTAALMSGSERAGASLMGSGAMPYPFRAEQA